MDYIDGGTAVDAALLMAKAVGVGIVLFLPFGWALESGSPVIGLVVWLIGIWWVLYLLLNHVERRIEEKSNQDTGPEAIEEKSNEDTGPETGDSVTETPAEHECGQ
ncbi:hypothetical protein [Natronorubrum sp. FCH18a]|uniref:hypothetical protein n=1 Tax=Natronorubrum sp. FCH18a TaxID=3447018 RepID=UPI003F5113BB